MKSATLFSAKTTNPNTPETDMQPFVMHTVTYHVDGELTEQQVLASEPGHAIKKVREALKSKGWQA